MKRHQKKEAKTNLEKVISRNNVDQFKHYAMVHVQNSGRINGLPLKVSNVWSFVWFQKK